MSTRTTTTKPTSIRQSPNRGPAATGARNPALGSSPMPRQSSATRPIGTSSATRTGSASRQPAVRTNSASRQTTTSGGAVTRQPLARTGSAARTGTGSATRTGSAARATTTTTKTTTTAAQRTGSAPRPSSAQRPGSAARNTAATRTGSAPRPGTSSSNTVTRTGSAARNGGNSGMVSTPRTGGTAAGRSPMLRVSPIRSAHSPQLQDEKAKSAQKKEIDAMNSRISKLMSMERPMNHSQGFRISSNDPKDLRTVHREKHMRDPLIAGTAIKCRNTTNHDHMDGITSERSFVKSQLTDDLTPRPTGKTHFPETYASAVESGTTTAAEAPIKQRRNYPEAHTTEIPWEKTKGLYHPLQRRTYPPGSGSEDNLLAPSPLKSRTPSQTTPSRTNMHHDVFGMSPSNGSGNNTPMRSNSADGGHKITIMPDEPERPTCTKRREQILREVAAEPPIELPPRRKPAVRPLGPTETDIFNLKPPLKKPLHVGVRINHMLSEACGSDPNDMIKNEPEVEKHPHKKFVEGSVKHGNPVIPEEQQENVQAPTRRSFPPQQRSYNIITPKPITDSPMATARSSLAESPLRTDLNDPSAPLRTSKKINPVRHVSSQVAASLDHTANDAVNTAANERTIQKSVRVTTREERKAAEREYASAPRRHTSPGMYNTKHRASMDGIMNWNK